MRICTISPPTITQFNNQQLADDEVKQIIAENAPLGLLSLAAVLERQSVLSHVVDLNHRYSEFVKEAGKESEAEFVRLVIRELDDLEFDAFGFSTICSTYPLT